MFESLKLSDLHQKNGAMLREPSSTRPVIWHIEEDGVKALVKDYRSNSFVFRNTVGRFLIWREAKAYRRLKGLKGVPSFFGVIDGLALILEEVEGRNVELLEKETRLPVRFFNALRHLVEQVHARGLAHCDLKRAPNIIIDRNGDPCIVDWSASISKREMRVFPLNRIYQKFIKDDFNAVIKLQLRHRPEAVDSETLKQYHYRGRAERLIRRVRDRARDLLQRIV